MGKSQVNPPKWADRFLQWYCEQKLINEIQGDLHEIFYLRSDKIGRFRAQWLFIWEVFRSSRNINEKTI